MSKPKKYSKELLIDRIHECATALNKTPSSKDMVDFHNIRCSIFDRYFGSWNQALIAAGYQPKEKAQKIFFSKKCEHCDLPFETDRKDAVYCSVSCSNKSRTLSEDERKQPTRKYNSREEYLQAMKDKTKRHLLESKFEDLGWDYKRARVIKEQNHSCNRCKLDKWQDKQIPLEIDHIDGDRKNNSRENLEALCPNCHALTETWRGRNKETNKRNTVTDEQLIKTLENASSIRDALNSVGLAPKGGNYKRARRLYELYVI